MGKRIATPSYYGSKHLMAPWIVQLLPQPTYYQTYIESFGGMAKVLMARTPVKVEMINDLDGFIVNWWRCVRDRTDDFIHKIEYTPHSRDELQVANDLLKNHALNGEIDIDLGWAAHVAMTQSVMHAVDKRTMYWGRNFTPIAGNCPKKYERSDILRIKNRIRRVQLENRDAIQLLQELKDHSRVVIYCDPPYRSSDTSPYQHGDFDVDAFTDALLAQSGAVAISGYGEEWDHLGWRKATRQNFCNPMGLNNAEDKTRTEVLWMSYEAEVATPLGL